MSLLRVLTYHRVVEAGQAGSAAPGLISATPRGFGVQMDWLVRRYKVVSLDAVMEAVAGGRRLPDDAVLLTFDDGYSDFRDVAWPILRAFRLPVTLFVPTAYPDRPEQSFWWDRLATAVLSSARDMLDVDGAGHFSLKTRAERVEAYRCLREHVKTLSHEQTLALVDEIWRATGAKGSLPAVLGWDALRRLSAAGVTIGPHTRTHPLLTRISEDRAREEIAGSLADVRREIGNCLPVFCYPGGYLDDSVVRVAANAGIQVAFTVIDGHNDLGTADRLRLRRTGITPRTTPWVFRMRLTKAGAAIDSWRHARRGQGAAARASA